MIHAEGRQLVFGGFVCTLWGGKGRVNRPEPRHRTRACTAHRIIERNSRKRGRKRELASPFAWVSLRRSTSPSLARAHVSHFKCRSFLPFFRRSLSDTLRAQTKNEKRGLRPFSCFVHSPSLGRWRIVTLRSITLESAIERCLCVC